MARIEVVMPQMGESIAEGTIVKWHKKIGEQVKKDETLLEISTDKVDSEIPSPASGVLAEIVAPEQTTVPVRTVIAYLETGGGVGRSRRDPRQRRRLHPLQPPAPVTSEPPAAGRDAGVACRPCAGRKARGRKIAFLFPARAEYRADRRCDDSGARVGPRNRGEGRVTKKDLLGYIQSRKGGARLQRHRRDSSPAGRSVCRLRLASCRAAGFLCGSAHHCRLHPRSSPAGRRSRPRCVRKKYPSPAHDLVPMSNVMQKMAQHMVHSVQTSPHVAAVHEVDMTARRASPRRACRGVRAE